MPKIAFDLDETLGVPLIEGSTIVGWQLRAGSAGLLDRLKTGYSLCLWSVSDRRYVAKALSFGLSRWFREVYTWDEIPAQWKDVRRIAADYLVDDSPHHREQATAHGISSAYIVVPAYGSPEDVVNPLGWAQLVEETVAAASKR